MTEQVKKHDFGEQLMENGMKVWVTPNYKSSRDKAIEMIDSGRYGLTDSDFWILKNRTRNGGISYASLIISHNGCLKINEALPEEKKFKSRFLSDIMPSPFGNGMIIKYDDGTLREYGEVNNANCKNDYPAAMLLKRAMDRVILKNSGLAFAGVYSEVEADDFSQAANEAIVEAPQPAQAKPVVQQTQPIQAKPVQSAPSVQSAPTEQAQAPVQAQVQQPAKVEAPMTSRQKSAITSIQGKLGIDGEVMKNRIKQITSRSSLDECTKSEASKVIDWLKEQQAVLATRAH